MSKSAISAECDEWADCNRDRGEGGSGLPFGVRFTNKLFKHYDEARDYLEGIRESYHETAVRYLEYPKSEPTASMKAVLKQQEDYRKRLSALNEPHYRGVKQATVKCKRCGSSLATAYCGKTYMNQCPVCGIDLRPESVLLKKQEYTKKLSSLEQRYNEEEKRQNEKNKKAAKEYWAVYCEVHC